MVGKDYEIRTPDKKILLFTYEEDRDGNVIFVARKGNRQERITYEKLLKILKVTCEKRK